MGLSCVIHNGIQILPMFNIDHNHIPRVSPPPPSKYSPLHFVHHHHHHHNFSSFFSEAVYNCRRAHCVPILCSKRVDKDGNGRLAASDVKRINAQPNEDNSNIESSKVKSTQESFGNQTYSSSVRTVALWVCAAVAFGVGLGFKDGVDKASEFFAGYILEQSLSVDNLFVFVLIFKYFKVPIMYQNRVLSYGIAGAVIFRLTLILLGSATLQRFEAVNLLLAAILLYSSFKLFASEEDESDLSNNYVVKTCQKFIPVTTYYDGNRFITNQDGMWKGSNILGRPPLYFLL